MTRLIKKYKNRRLYDTEISEYITVYDLQRYVVDGTAFRVLDSTTEVDITSATLLQIFVEMESGATQFLSAEMLRQLIILAHHPLNQSFKDTLGQLFSSMETFMKTNPYQPLTMLWQQQLQEMATQWQKYFKLSWSKVPYHMVVINLMLQCKINYLFSLTI